MRKAMALTPLISLIVLAFTAVSFAQQPAPKIAVINSQTAFETSVEGKKALAQLQEMDTKVKADLQKMDDAIRALQSRLSTGRLTMTQEAFIAASADLEKKQTERKRYEEDKARESQQFGNNLVGRIRTEMVSVIQALRKEKGYDIVLDLGTSGLVDFDPALDITVEVVRRYDASKAATPPVKK
jgi:outer membrane protein